MDNQKNPNNNPSASPVPAAPRVDPSMVYPNPDSISPPNPSSSTGTPSVIYSANSSQVNSPKSARFFTFKRIFWVAILFFVIFPVVAAILAGPSGSWGTVGLIFAAIFNTVLLVTIWAIHKWWIHSKQKDSIDKFSPNIENTPGQMGQPTDRSTFFIKIGVILFVLSALGILSAVLTKKNMTVASGYPIHYALFIYFVEPVSVLIGIGMAIWAISQLGKSQRRSLLVIAAFLSLSPIWSGVFSMVILTSKITQSPLEKSLNKTTASELGAFPFRFYLPPSSSSFHSNYFGEYSSAEVQKNSQVKVAHFRITNTSAGKSRDPSSTYIFDLYMLKADQQYAVGSLKTSTCYTPDLVTCNYSFTTPKGNIVLTASKPSFDAYTSKVYDFFQKDNTYLYLTYEQSNAHPSNVNWPQFIDSLQQRTFK